MVVTCQQGGSNDRKEIDAQAMDNWTGGAGCRHTVAEFECMPGRSRAKSQSVQFAEVCRIVQTHSDVERIVEVGR